MSQDRTVTEIERLLACLRDGDLNARDTLFQCARHRMERLAHKMLEGFPRVRAGGYWTDDVLDPAAMKLYKLLQAMVPPPATALHFFRLTAQQIRRELIDLTRRLKNRPHFVPLPSPVPDGDGSSGGVEVAGPTDNRPDELAIWTEFHETVGRLPEPSREVFDLLWYQGVTQVEAAEMLGICPKTVRKRWIEARMAVCDELGGQLPGLTDTGRFDHD
jgi:RNA polymerase sigma-70 factor (ECF subfamily)